MRVPRLAAHDLADRLAADEADPWTVVDATARAGEPSPTAKPEWFRGPDRVWDLAQEVAWLEAQVRPEVLRGYQAALRRRVLGFDGASLPRDERRQLEVAVRRCLDRLESAG